MAQVRTAFEVDPDRGLSDEEARARLERDGPNELAAAPPEPVWKKLAAQFKDLVIWILIAAAIIAGAMGEWVDTAAILAIVVLNGALGFLQEERAEQALEALRNMAAPEAHVLRGGKVRAVEARAIVAGDVLALEAGDNISADARIIESFGARAQEAALTGESVPVDKTASVLLEENTRLADRRTMVYMGTVLAAGKARAIVTATGMQTELGNIAGLLGRYEREQTPLERRLAELGKVLIVVCLALVAIVFVLQWQRGGAPIQEVFLISVSLAVAAVPEGLPAVVTISLALGLQRMVRRNALVRKLPSVETLGSVTVICSDKTGTLTRNEMTVREIATHGAVYEATGSGYAPEGSFRKLQHAPPAGADPRAVDGQEVVDTKAEVELYRALLAGARCNNAQLARPDQEGADWRIVGDPTEAALVVAAAKAGIDANPPHTHPIAELPFDSDRKAMSIVLPGEDGQPVMYTKGAPEAILGMCTHEFVAGELRPLDDDRRCAIAARAADMAARALRVLAVAFRPSPRPDGESYQERGLALAGLVGMIDPPRDEVRKAIARCRAAGIRPVMITGDHPSTARAIALELQMTGDDDHPVTGEELDRLDAHALAERVERITVYARVSPEHKLDIVRAWQSRSHVVAMTGDGVNDAPAVKAANIGVAMGITGTDVTKEASDMVLVDDNFASIVNAVEEGRGIFDNIQKFVHYLLSCNAGEVLVMFVAAMFGRNAPLVAIQILWINLVTDGLPALALAMEPPERDIMQRPPRPPHEPVITARSGLLIALHGSLIGTAGLAAFWLMDGFDATAGAAVIDHARTATFGVVAFAQLFFSFACRSHSRTLPELGIGSNPYLFAAIGASGALQLAVLTLPFVRPVFQTAPLDGGQWLSVVLLSLAPVTVIELEKLARAALRRGPRG